MSKRLLVVDDSTVSRMMVKAIIQEQFPDAEVFEAKDADDALNSLRECGQIDIAIVDYNMPGLNGLQLYEKLQSCVDIQQRALLTANIQQSIKAQAESQGIIFLNKPISEDVIVPFITGGPG